MIKKNLLKYFFIFFVSGILALLVEIKSRNDYQTALSNYRQSSHYDALDMKLRLEKFFLDIQQNLRTISFLPSVRNIQRHGENLDGNAHESIQQIYNNLKSNVAVSEIYIVPIDLEPDSLDPVTNEPQAPILMFDKLIMSEKDRQVEQESGIPAVEIYEYRALKDQMAWFKKHYSNISSVDKLDLPFISSENLITCDNSIFLDTKLDADRSGIMLSVPFYGSDDNIKGTITAVVLTNNIRNIISGGDYSLFNKKHNYFVMQNNGQAIESKEFILEGNQDPNLLFSEVLTLKINNPQSPWKLWVGHNNIAFLDSEAVKSIKYFRFISLAAIIIIYIFSTISFFALNKNIETIKLSNDELENRVRSRTAQIEELALKQQQISIEAEERKRKALQDMAYNLEIFVKELVLKIVNVSIQMQSASENAMTIAQDTKQRAEIVANSSSDSVSNSMKMASGAKVLSDSIKDVSSQTDLSKDNVKDASIKAEAAKQIIDLLNIKSEKINKILLLIANIAEQINLLALNATIESARAGEAGRGFAVVANEVKNLSEQVAKASEEINNQMKEIASSTKDSVQAVIDILNSVGQVSSISINISNAVRQQADITTDIVNNIISAGDIAKQISDHILSVKDGADKSHSSAKDAMQLAKDLAQESEGLRVKINEFTALIREG
jgi:methyl-accepting chemotaxis protein